MSDADPGDRGPSERGDDETSPQAGVLGNLPRSRPAVRSPRRKLAPDPAGDAQRAAAAGRPPAGELDDGPESGPTADLEALARTGLSVAGGAASLGLRIAGRAAAAVRDAVERR